MSRFLAFALLVALTPTIACGKCITTWHDITGIVAAADATPIPNAKVVVAWSVLTRQVKETSVVQTDANGRYSVHLPFYTGSGSTLFGDVCKAILSKVSIEVSAPEYEPSGSIVPVGSGAVTANYSLKRTAANRHGVN